MTASIAPAADPVSKVKVARLLAVCDPFTNPWGGKPFTPDEVRQAVAEGKLKATPYSKENGAPRRGGRWSRREHIEHIAWLVVNGWSKPVDIDVGVPSMGCTVKWPLQDGNHRLAAAHVRGDKTLPAVVSGCVQTAFKMLGVRI